MLSQNTAVSSDAWQRSSNRAARRWCRSMASLSEHWLQALKPPSLT